MLAQAIPEIAVTATRGAYKEPIHKKHSIHREKILFYVSINVIDFESFFIINF